MNYIEVWFLTRATKDGEPVICQMLVDFDATAKGGDRICPPSTDEAGREYPHDNPLVQAWGYKVLDSGSGFGSLHLPDEISGRCADCARRARRGVESADEIARRHNALASLK